MILVTGGTRSGKSEFAEQLVMRRGERYLYMATAKITDEEMARRVEKHQKRRSSRWTTHEGYHELWRVLEEEGKNYDGILLDSVSSMLTNLLFDFIGEVDWDTFDFADVDFKAAAAEQRKLPLVVVTDEIGLGVIPDTYLGRAFRDMMGLANQKLAAAADEVYFVISGIPVKIKGE